MVTLRRDIAAAGNNKVFDRKNRDAEVLTDYDLFMEKKKQQRVFCDYKPVAPAGKTERKSVLEDKADNCDAFSKIFNRATENEAKVSINQQNDEEYKQYLIDQLNRKEPTKLLDKESFYSKRYEQPELVCAKATVKTERSTSSKLSKNGKIFIAVYVLVVALVASIILAVNSVSEPQRVDASAISDNAKGEIAPLEISAENENANANWFDKLLDGLSNG